MSSFKVVGYMPSWSGDVSQVQYSKLSSLVSLAHAAGVKVQISVGGGGGDYMVIMAYNDNNFQHSTFELAPQCMNYWLGRGCPASKAILGVPFYGHDSSQDPNSDAAEVNYKLA